MKTKIGYKLFEMDKNGRLFPLFIDKGTEIPVGKWVHAKYVPSKGFATRGGFHIGEMPDAPWLKAYNGTDSGYYRSRFRHGKRVWCEIEYNATNDYNDVVKTMPKKCISDGVPKNGYYFFREAGKGVWSITSDIKVVRIIDESERLDILHSMGHDEEEAYAKYKNALAKRVKFA